MSHLLLRNIIRPFSHSSEPMALMTFLGSLALFLLFIVHQPLEIRSVPYPDMMLMELFGYNSSKAYMHFLYFMTGVVSVAVLYLTAYIMRGAMNMLSVMVLAFIAGYVVMASYAFISISAILSLSCLWVFMVLTLCCYNDFIKQFISYGFLMMASCLMPHFGMTMAVSCCVFLLYPVLRRDISWQYYFTQLIIIASIVILGATLSVFTMGFDIQSFKAWQPYANGMLLSALMYALYHIVKYMMHMPRINIAYYASHFIPLIAISLISGRFIGTLI